MTTIQDSRTAILNNIRAARRRPVGRPAVSFPPVSGNPVSNFCNRLTAFDGRILTFNSRADALAWFRGSVIDPRRRVYSSVSGIPSESFSDPHAANVVDVCLADGIIGVGETGSVWVTDASLGLTAAALFATDLYLLLDRRNIVDGIHTAYERIDICSTPYGAFYTGPSATADIEAVHITGAQAFISLTVLLY